VAPSTSASRAPGRPAAAAPSRRPAAAALLLLAGLAAWWRGGAAPAWAEAPRPLGRLEQESVDEALAARQLAIDPRPQGKTVGAIHVVNQEVFSQRDWWFQWFNVFHRTTRENVIRREILLRPGQPYDEALVEESIRNLQSTQSVGGSTFVPPEVSSVVAILPVAAPLRPGEVDLLVVTRDLWSLRFNTNFEFQQNTLAFLATSLSENNLFGWRKFLSIGFTLDQGTMGFGPSYYDPNVAGTRLTLLATADLWYARDSERYEGNDQTFSLAYPLFSLASRWGAEIDVAHYDTVVRTFRGNSLRLEDLAATPDVVEQIPDIYRQRRAIVDSSVVRSFIGASAIQRVTLGHYFESRRFSVLPDFPGDAATAQLYLDQFAPVSEQRSEPYVAYQVFTPRFAVFRDLDTFDLRENRALGPSLSVRIGYGLPALGADFRALALSETARWSVNPGNSFLQVAVTASTRLRDGAFIDQALDGQLYAATPLLARAFRLVMLGEAAGRRADSQRLRYVLGGRTGLRGYAIGDFVGTSELVGHLELRSVALPIFSQRFGGLLFWDVGDAAPSFRAIVPHHDFGVGLRWLIPQLNSSVVRIDWALATQSTTFTQAGLPGRFTAGFQQVF
jgi:hypothetical protein